MKDRLPPLLSERPPALRIVLAGVVPLLFGVFAGVMLGVNEIAYDVVALLGVAGGFAAGLEHHGGRSGFRRGLLGGSLFGLGILLAHGAFFDSEPKADLPDPEGLLVVITTAFGGLLGALGGRRRAKLEPRHADASGAAKPSATPRRPPTPIEDAQAAPWNAVVDINAAPLDQLTMLHTVGRGAAQRIIAYREENGPFASVEDLTHVEGFTASRVAQLAHRATV
jgi:competence ComEA-like helix-hairpin-helix protein